MTNKRMQALAARALSYYLQEGHSEEITCSIESFGFRAEIRLCKSQQKQLTECEQTILSLLSQQNGVPRTTDELFRDMDSTGQIHGESTTRLALSRMIKRGLLDYGPSKKGYLITRSGLEMLKAFSGSE